MQRQPLQLPEHPRLRPVLPYEGGALDINSQTGSILYQDAIKMLDEKYLYDGKPEHLYPFIAALKGCVTKCKWDDDANGVIINIGPHDLNLLTDYGRLDKADLLQARADRNQNGTVRARQNAGMFYHCIWNSLSSSMRESLDTDPELHNEIQEDGPLLFYKLVSMTQETTFIQANAMRDQLNTLHPKKYSYNIKSTNEFIHRALRVMRAASEDGRSPSRQEALYFIFGAYKKIKSPPEWVQTIQFYENQMASTPALANEETLYEKAEALQQKISKSSTGWKPSDKSPEEQVIAMMADGKGKGKSNNRRSSGKSDSTQGSDKNQQGASTNKPRPPFTKSDGKEGDTKKWKNRTWYYCSYDHKDGHWVTHKPTDCILKKKQKQQNNSSSSTSASSDKKDTDNLVMDRNKLKHSMAAVFAGSGIDIDPSDMINATIDALQQE